MTDRWTDRLTDGPTDRVGCRVACTQLKTKQTKENQWKYEVMEVRKGMQRKKGKHKEILLKFFHDFLVIL